MRKQVTWDVGTTGQAGTPVRRAAQTRHDRCMRKIAQIERHLLALDRNPAVNASAIRFQRQRVAWLRWVEMADEAALDAVRADLINKVGLKGVAMLKDGVPPGISDEQKFDLAHLAILDFAVNER